MPFRGLGSLLAGFFLLMANGCDKEESQKSGSSQIGADTSALSEFTRRVEEYAALRRRIAGPFGAIDQTKNPEEIARREDALRNAIIATRAQPKAGNIFAPGAAAILKSIIKNTYRRSPELQDTHKDAEIEVPDFVPAVNTVYPTTFPLGTFSPTLLRVLPELPEGLEYRIVTHHLILRDTEANLIVDVLPNAIP